MIYLKRLVGLQDAFNLTGLDRATLKTEKEDT